MNKKVIVVGTGGHAKGIVDIIIRNKDIMVGFFAKLPGEESYLGYPILGTESEYEKYPDCLFIAAVGSAVIREDIVRRMPNAKWYTAVHPTAVVSEIETEIGEGTVLLAGSIVNAGAKIGKHVILNTGSIVEHDNVIDDYAHISVGTKLAGEVAIGKGSWIGIGAVVNNGISIASGVTIGAGAVVVKNIETPGVYVGIPAKKIK